MITLFRVVLSFATVTDTRRKEHKTTSIYLNLHLKAHSAWAPRFAALGFSNMLACVKTVLVWLRDSEPPGPCASIHAPYSSSCQDCGFVHCFRLACCQVPPRHWASCCRLLSTGPIGWGITIPSCLVKHWNDSPVMRPELQGVKKWSVCALLISASDDNESAAEP